MQVKAVILAAGESSRFWPLSQGRHKCTIKLMDKPIILWTMESLAEAGIKDFVIVQSKRRDVEKALGGLLPDNWNVSFVIQEDARGMGDAVEKAKDLIDDYFLVLNPNHPDAKDFVLPMLNLLEKRKCDGVLLGKETNEPWNYGIFIMENGKPKGIVEKPEKGKEPSNIRVMGMYLLSKKFFDYHNVEKGHYSYEEALDGLLKNEDIEVLMTDKSTLSLKYPWHLLDFAKHLLGKIKEQRISENADIKGNAIIEGNVVVEDGAKIMENAVVKGPAYIGKNCLIGNNAVIRESIMERDSIAGCNSEVARTVFLGDVHVHSGFFGDSILAEGTRVGAGTIFANVRLDRGEIKTKVKGKIVSTGRTKLGAITGMNVKIGINCSIMPGVLIKPEAKIMPASLITKNVE